MAENPANLVDFPNDTETPPPLADELAPKKAKAWADCIYYDGQKFWIENEVGEWISLHEQATRRTLKAAGVLSDLTKEERSAGLKLSEVDKIINEVEINRRIVWAGPLAGRPAGCYFMGGQRVLVTSTPQLIAAEAPDEADDSVPRLDPAQWAVKRPSDKFLGECVGWPNLGHFWRNLFTCYRTRESHPGELPEGWAVEDFDQLVYFLGWLQRSLLGLYHNQRVKGHAILLAGEPGCGKSLTIWIIQQLFGGRVSRPLGWIEGRTQFNSNMFKSPLLVVDDEGAKTRIQDRKILSAQTKQVTAVMGGEMEGKGKDSIELEPFWRLIFATNLEEQNLLIFPPIDNDIRDKIMLFKAYREPWPWGDRLTEPEIQRLLRREFPFFLHWLFNKFEVPPAMYEQRWGLVNWLHPEIRQKIEHLSPEIRLWGFIERTVLRSANTYGNEALPHGMWKGSATDLEVALRDKDNPLTFKEREKIPAARPTLGQYLNTLKAMPDYQGQITDGRTGKARFWTLKTRELVDKELATGQTELPAGDQSEGAEELY